MAFNIQTATFAHGLGRQLCHPTDVSREPSISGRRGADLQSSQELRATAAPARNLNQFPMAQLFQLSSSITIYTSPSKFTTDLDPKFPTKTRRGRASFRYGARLDLPGAQPLCSDSQNAATVLENPKTGSLCKGSFILPAFALPIFTSTLALPTLKPFASGLQALNPNPTHRVWDVLYYNYNKEPPKPS